MIIISYKSRRWNKIFVVVIAAGGFVLFLEAEVIIEGSISYLYKLRLSERDPMEGYQMIS